MFGILLLYYFSEDQFYFQWGNNGVMVGGFFLCSRFPSFWIFTGFLRFNLFHSGLPVSLAALYSLAEWFDSYFWLLCFSLVAVSCFILWVCSFVILSRISFLFFWFTWSWVTGCNTPVIIRPLHEYSRYSFVRYRVLIIILNVAPRCQRILFWYWGQISVCLMPD